LTVLAILCSSFSSFSAMLVACFAFLAECAIWVSTATSCGFYLKRSTFSTQGCNFRTHFFLVRLLRLLDCSLSLFHAQLRLRLLLLGISKLAIVFVLRTDQQHPLVQLKFD
jgi:hypothetical protein